jgi:hypothetical protein
MVMLGATHFYNIFNMYSLYITSGLHLWNMVDIQITQTSHVCISLHQNMASMISPFWLG